MDFNVKNVILILFWIRSNFQSVVDLLQRFKDSRYVSTIPDFEESWLKDFLNVVNKTAEALYLDPQELLSKENFMTQLQQFLQVSISLLKLF